MTLPPPPPPPGAQPPGFGPPGAIPPPGYQAYQQIYQAAPNYASFGARLGALLLDGLVALVFSIPAIVAVFAGPRELQACEINGRDRLCNAPTGATIGIAVLLGLAGAVAFIVVYCRKVGAGQSWGQKATGVRVVDAVTGAPIGTGRAVGRFFARYLSGFLCYLGYLWMLWDPKKQTWHDKIVGTIVVRA